MSWSDATASPAFEEIRRTAALAALARDELAPGSAHDGAPCDLPVIWQLATADIGGSIDSSADDPATRLANLITAAGQLGTACRGGGVDSSTDVSDTRLVNRIIAATRHDDIIKVLPLLRLRAIADRLDYLHKLTCDDPNEPPIVLASLREFALFFVGEPQLDEPEIGIGPDGLLHAEWSPQGGGVVAMKFLPAGLIQFAAVFAPTGGGQQPPVHGTEPKDRALDAVRAFIR